MGESSARIGPGDRCDAFGVPEQVAKCIQMMDRHVEKRQSIVVLQERLPVWDRPHFDGGQHRLSKIAALEDLLEHADRLIELHVLVHRQNLAGGFRFDDQRSRRVEVHGERLLGENRPDMRLSQCVANEGGLLIRRKGDVKNFDLRVSISALGVSHTVAMFQRCATCVALALVREAMAATGKPAAA